MKLGILVNSDRHLTQLRDITKAALQKGHDVEIFVMDDGAKLLTQDSLVKLILVPNVSLSVCELSAARHGIDAHNLPGGVSCGGQYGNAMMNHDADRVIVL
ncbi:MAG: DsrE family protein [Gammaproteobacteria bacterium]